MQSDKWELYAAYNVAVFENFLVFISHIRS